MGAWLMHVQFLLPGTQLWSVKFIQTGQLSGDNHEMALEWISINVKPNQSDENVLFIETGLYKSVGIII